MSRSIIGGLTTSGFNPTSIGASDPAADNLEQLRAFGVDRLSGDNATIASQADVIVLAVKPQVLQDVCISIAATLTTEQLVISIAAGVEASDLNRWLGGAASVVRCMPNTPALLRLGASALYAYGEVSDLQRDRAETVMSAVGVLRWVNDEALMHAVTAVSGSGPAYFFQFMEAMIDEAVRMGLDAETARALCAQTCIGAGQMVAEGDVDASELRRRVCSPGGTTERAVAAFDAGGLSSLVSQAMRDCYKRSEELAKELA